MKNHAVGCETKLKMPFPLSPFEKELRIRNKKLNVETVNEFGGSIPVAAHNKRAQHVFNKRSLSVVENHLKKNWLAFFIQLFCFLFAALLSIRRNSPVKSPFPISSSPQPLTLLAFSLSLPLNPNRSWPYGRDATQVSSNWSVIEMRDGAGAPPKRADRPCIWSPPPLYGGDSPNSFNHSTARLFERCWKFRPGAECQ